MLAHFCLTFETITGMVCVGDVLHELTKADRLRGRNREIDHK
jgi:hypothetical protein